MPADAEPITGQRRPTAEDIPEVLDLVAGGSSLRKACESLGLHTPSTHTFINDDEKLREQYAGAREGRADHYQEKALEFGEAAATGRPVEIDGEPVQIDPAGFRAYLDSIKWATARMAPKTAPVQRLSHSFESLDDDDLDKRIAALSGGGGEPPSDP